MISVVIPAYNAEKTLERAVESVLVQGYQDYEILIVENGSTDNTYKLALDLERRDSRIRVFQSEKGVSTARNYGLRKAMGRWVTFLDADDVYYDGSFARVMNMNPSADILITQLDADNKNSIYDFFYDDRIQINNYIAKCMCKPTTKTTVHGVFFSNEFLRTNGIVFDKELRLAEDSVFFILSALRSSSMQGLKIPLYNIIYNAESTIGANNRSMVNDFENSISSVIEMVNGIETLTNPLWLFILNQLLIILVHDVVSANIVESVRMIKTVCNRVIFKNAINNSVLAESDWKYKLVFRLLKARMYISVYFIVRMRQIQNKKRYR